MSIRVLWRPAPSSRDIIPRFDSLGERARRATAGCLAKLWRYMMSSVATPWRPPCMWDATEALLKASLRPQEDQLLQAWVQGWRYADLRFEPKTGSCLNLLIKSSGLAAAQAEPLVLPAAARDYRRSVTPQGEVALCWCAQCDVPRQRLPPGDRQCHVPADPDTYPVGRQLH
eukprot:scaffold66003_cov63-Phaeocystis_antarctica.AAC.3